ncbi:MAG: hypothetical protein ACXWYG_10685 [Aeromicrobium sp.]
MMPATDRDHDSMTPATDRTLHLGTRAYPLVLPSLRDPRLHLAAVIITIHILGQVALGFRISVPQIVVAIITCAVLELGITFARERRVVWPASGMLTGSGVALILRLVGMGRDQHWTWRGWYLFAAVAGLSLLSKYLIRRRGTHLFNPSNLGLVLAFVVLGSNIIEPLDFWWAPLGPAMVFAYLVILAGGLAVTSRLHLLPMAIAFWGALAVGLGALAASGHCITTAWSLTPVCGSSFWWVLVTSPEVLIFLFFMITDPKTIPRGRAARVVFAVGIATLSVLLIAPQTNEFGAKVGLLAGLVILTPFSLLFDRLAPDPDRTAPNRIMTLLTMRGSPGPARIFGRGATVGLMVMAVLAGVVVAGAPARDRANAAQPFGVAAIDVDVDLTTLPLVTVDHEVAALNSVAADDPGVLAAGLVRALAIEAEAMRRADTSLLRAADDGPRLVEMERAIERAATSGRLPVPTYRFTALRLVVEYVDGPQGGANLAFQAEGTVQAAIYNEAGDKLDTTEAPFASNFVLRTSATGDWIIWQTDPQN